MGSSMLTSSTARLSCRDGLRPKVESAVYAASAIAIVPTASPAPTVHVLRRRIGQLSSGPRTQTKKLGRSPSGGRRAPSIGSNNMIEQVECQAARVRMIGTPSGLCPPWVQPAFACDRFTTRHNRAVHTISYRRPAMSRSTRVHDSPLDPHIDAPSIRSLSRVELSE